jgi:hypothetical protein
MNRLHPAALAAIALASLASSALRAEDAAVPRPAPLSTPASSDFAISVMGGPLLPGSISIGDAEPDTNVGLIGRFAMDAMVAPKLSVGAYASFASTSFRGSDIGARSYGFGATLKGHFALGPAQVRPGLALAFQISDIDQSDSVNGLGAGAFLETAYPVVPRMNLVLHAGFLTQPTGGNSNVDVTWAPIFYFATGLEFSL